MTLITEIFSIQTEIANILPFGYNIVDSGMYVPGGEETELWRDMTVEMPNGNDFYISYSTDGNIKHDDVPQRILLQIKDVLSQYRK